MSNRKWLRWSVVVVALVLTVAIVALYAMRSRAVLWRPYEGESESIGGPSSSILNPFRNREPERPAEIFLNKLKSKNCAAALAALPFDGAYRSYICGKEAEHHLFSWRMTDREDTPEKVRIFY